MGMELVAALASVAAAVCAATAIAMQVRAHRELERSRARMDEASEQMARANEALVSVQSVLSQVLTTMQATLNQAASTSIIEQQHFDSQVRAIDQVSSKADEARREIAQNLEQNRGAVEQRLDKVRETVDVQLSAIRRDNELKLEAIRATVDEKLATTLNDRLGASFKQVSSQLEAVYRGLGDMQNIASGVGDLKRVLSNVKTRGILGEVQLGAILRDILTADQYAENVATKPGSAERVEFAVKLPVEGGDPIWLPIDSKFPGDTYEHLRDAIEAGDAEGVAAARRALEQVIKAEAKDISSKYLSVPETTNFAIMFLPFEGLYAEVVDRPGLIECLQRDYQVNIAGPSTMAVILNSLQMSYQTFAFQRRADEIQRVLSAVKAEFPKYQAELRRALRQIETAGKTVDGIINTRTNVIERKLKSVTAMEDGALAAELLEISDVSSDVADDEE
ncbi:RmuC domain protein [Collinsella intestinalis DSM 13280]|uniref:RmuC domain protein n=1 Tax=Collinsella intestinalis DSM 13280 TaxID=521003 RepID=C4FAK0_9ACTN|nr:DNA recombination protein RmuC [Collinsella intestinalis]EEP44134.1 RmuC domain protein [Collinsella intestinalis DSM 13280]